MSQNDEYNPLGLTREKSLIENEDGEGKPKTGLGEMFFPLTHNLSQQAENRKESNVKMPTEFGPIGNAMQLYQASMKDKEGVKGGEMALAGLGDVSSFGTRFLGAAARNRNPFASEETKQKTFKEALADPEGGLFKEARMAVKNSDMNSVVKMLVEFGISIPEDPVSALSGLLKGVSVISKAAKSASKASNIKVKNNLTNKLDDSTLKLKEEIYPSSLTPGQKEYIETGKLTKETGGIELKSMTASPKTIQELADARKAEIDGLLENMKQTHFRKMDNLTSANLHGKAIDAVEETLDKYTKTKDALYEGVNNALNNVKLYPQEVTDLSGIFRNSGLMKKSGRDLVLKSYTDLNLDEKTMRNLKDVMVSLSDLSKKGAFDSKLSSLSYRDLDGNIKTVGRILSETATEDGRRIVGGIYNKLKDFQYNFILKRKGEHVAKDLTTANHFVNTYKDGMKIIRKIMIDKAKNPRNGIDVMKDLNKIVSKDQKGKVIDTFMDFMDEKSVESLRNFIFNDMITKGKGGVDNIAKAFNNAPRQVVERLFTKEMLDDLSEIATRSYVDKVARGLTPSTVKKFTNADKDKALRLLNINPFYSFMAFRDGESKLGVLKFMTAIELVNALLKMKKGMKVKKAEAYLKETGNSKIGLTFRALRKSVTPSISPLKQKGPILSTAGRATIDDDSDTDDGYTEEERRLFESLEK